MICSKCGYVAKDNDRFCIRCGSPLRMPEPPVKAPEAVSAPEVCEPAAAEPAAPAAEDKPEVPEMILAEDIPAGAEAEVKEAAAEIKEAAEPVREMPVVEDPPMPEVPVEPARAEAPAAPVIPVKPAEPVKPVIPVKPAEPVKPVEKPVKADAAAEAACEDSRLEKPLSVWGYIWRIVFFSIPVLCIIPLFIMAFSSGINKNSKHFAAAVLILKLVAVLACIGILIYILLTTDPTVISNYINQTLEKLRGMAN
ncbi:MAG: zinc ribbon domain-containing protein [Clostridia bacterium]|nr:zinc ribbon domain-containing protein [Clostridia bacterium]MBQ4341535.1 zinc ribbon domain-containing protein [Clostridia bacterium]